MSTLPFDPTKEAVAPQGDGSLSPQLPEWQSFAAWTGEGADAIAESGVSIRVSPSWYTPRWSRLDALSIDTCPHPDADSTLESSGDSAPASSNRWTALRRTNHLVASVTR